MERAGGSPRLKKVLIAEDFADIRKMMKILLGMYGYEVIEAADGSEAIERAVNSRPDLILMDISMPVLDGIQATKAIRNYDGLSEVPIVAITAYGDTYSDQAQAAGCNEVIRKPLDLGQLKPLVQQYLP